MTSRCVDNLVNPLKGEGVFGEGVVEIQIINAYPPLPILLGYHNKIDQAIQVLDLLEEAYQG